MPIHELEQRIVQSIHSRHEMSHIRDAASLSLADLLVIAERAFEIASVNSLISIHETLQFICQRSSGDDCIVASQATKRVDLVPVS